eukprot:TRINITY_DN6321_c0_g1_i1.p1 TRINITY_DN6321_c0_g1~~TRINITY_DN6321_c0_g1_i1.p1  ORF type:complete len:154 (+),score=39.17 TRINITY_DN6321_c0_g1_i1:568-1029(+)
MSKRIDVGPMAPMVKNVSTVYDTIFDHRAAIQAEQQIMIREFETKRGNLDIVALQTANGALAAPLDLSTKCQTISENNMDKLIAASKEANRIARETLAKEQSHVAQRTKLRQGGEMMEAEQSAQYLAEQQKRMAMIDETFEHQKKALEEKYKV